jgi:hypothetical protein
MDLKVGKIAVFREHTSNTHLMRSAILVFEKKIHKSV